MKGCKENGKRRKGPNNVEENMGAPKRKKKVRRRTKRERKKMR